MKILLFGPNGSGKGTQGAILKHEFAIPHIESGAIFRHHIKGGTQLGVRAREYIDQGILVPDDLTIPMILERLQERDCRNGWLLDGFPRNPNQAIHLREALAAGGLALDIVVEILLDREIAKNRIMGRRICTKDANHPNNLFIKDIKPDGDRCRVCGGELVDRSDDQDEAAIAQRHDIYFDQENGTMAAVMYFKEVAAADPDLRYLAVDGRPSLEEVKAELRRKLEDS
jgi:adenylate kinase